MQAKSAACDHAEVAAPAPQCPEKITIAVLGRPQRLAFGRYDISFDEVVAGQAVFADQPTDSAAQGEACHPVLEIKPPVVARPWFCVAWSKSSQVAPG